MAAYLCVAPWLIGFLALQAGPMLLSLGLSFTDYAVLKPDATRFVGIENYRHALLEDSSLRTALRVTVYYAVLAVVLDLVVGLGLALLLNHRRLPCKTFFRSAIYLPSLLPGVAVGVLWLWIFQPQAGLANVLLRAVGLPPSQWVYSTQTVIPSLALMSMWTVGRSVLVFLAALQGLPAELLEAAALDGAGRIERLRAITLPLITPAILLNLVLDVIANLQLFTQAFVVTRGGPAEASLVYVLYLYRVAFEEFRMGYASALAWLLLLLLVGVTLLIFRSSSRWVYYEGDVRTAGRA